MSGLGKVFQFDGQVAYAASEGVPLANLAIIISIIAELAAATMIILGYRARLGALILLVWMIPVSIMLHAFWNIEDAMAQQMHMIMFMKNLAMMGAMLLIMSFGPGPKSINQD
jgi:putative oxidoreductase